jgi:hypothetical protein
LIEVNKIDWVRLGDVELVSRDQQVLREELVVEKQGNQGGFGNEEASKWQLASNETRVLGKPLGKRGEDSCADEAEEERSSGGRRRRQRR